MCVGGGGGGVRGGGINKEEENALINRLYLSISIYLY